MAAVEYVFRSLGNVLLVKVRETNFKAGVLAEGAQ